MSITRFEVTLTHRHPVAVSRRTLLAGAGALCLPPAWAAAVPRVAVVLGNAAYAGAPLLNPVRDATAIGARLAALGFQVIERRDATRTQMAAAIDEAAAALQGREGVGLLYFAGHGLQIDWRNYMLPVDMAITSAADVPRQALDVQQVLAAFRAAGTRTNVVVLDACRDNPFGAAASARGLAPLDAPPGTFLAYATAPGHLAGDGSAADGHGVYTRHLLKSLEQPEAPIEDVFKRVRAQVRQATGGRQIPWESTSLEEDFAFASGRRLEAAGLRERESQFERQRRDWERIRGSQQPDDYFAFLEQHPSGVFAELAQASLDRLTRPVVLAQAQAGPAAAATPTLAPGEDRYRLGDGWVAEQIDLLGGGRRSLLERRVTAVEGERVVINRGEMVLDQLGTLLYNRTGRKDPGLLIAPSQMRVGMRWRSDFSNQPDAPGVPASRNFYDYRVKGLEDLELPFGRVRCFRVVGEGRAVLPTTSFGLFNDIWLDTESLWMMKSAFSRVPQGARQPDMHDVQTLVSRHRPR